MLVLVFVSDDGKGGTTGPTLFLRAEPGAKLPHHPRSLEWRYFATISEEDELLAGDSEQSRVELHQQGFHIANRMI